MKHLIAILFSGLWLSSCIGTDVLDDPLIEPELIVAPEVITLLIGDDQALTFSYFDEFGVQQETSPTWLVDNTEVATVSNAGVVTGVAAGQTQLRGVIDGTSSMDVLITVAESEDDIIKVLISEPASSSLGVGSTIQLTATAWNINDDLIENQVVQWESSDNQIATITQDGLLMAISNGVVSITATIEGISSVPLEFEIGSQALSAEFQGVSGYTAVGVAEMTKDENGDIILTFSDDFRTSFALGTFIYLSNSTSGSDTKGGGLQLAEITTNGAKTFNVTAVDSSVELNSYRYVIILCFPASLTFGFADFQE